MCWEHIGSFILFYVAKSSLLLCDKIMLSLSASAAGQTIRFDKAFMVIQAKVVTKCWTGP